MKKKILLTPIALVASMLMSGVYAQESTLVLGEVSVTAPKEGSLPTKSILTSVDVMGKEYIEDKNVKNSWELLGQMPGAAMKSWQMGFESGKPAFRGFNGEGYINGIKLLIDGVPSNTNNGNMRYMDMIFPVDIEYIEVVRGTNDPRYGLHNIGGNINVVTRQGGSYSDGRISYGSFNTRDLQAALGVESEGWEQNYYFAKYDSDGYREHSMTDKYAFGGKWFYKPKDGNLKLGLVVRNFEGKADEAGYLTSAEYESNPKQNPSRSANDTDVRRMQHISGHAEYLISSDLRLNSKIYYNGIQDDRRMTYPSTTTAKSQNRNWNESHTGILTNVVWELNKVVTLDSGLNYERQDNQFRRYGWTTSNFSGPSNSCTTTVTDASPSSACQDYTVDNLGAYVQAIIKPSQEWKFVPGYRVDKFDGTTKNVKTGLSYDMNDYGWISQPKMSVVYSPSNVTSIYANWGKTFQILTGGFNGGTDGPYASNQTAASINTGKEIGVKAKLTSSSEGRLAAWEHNGKNEISTIAATGVSTPLGVTKRRGIDIQLTSYLTTNTKAWLFHTLQEAKVGEGVFAGKEIFGTPKYITNIGLDHKSTEKWSYGFLARAQSDYYIDQYNNQGKYGEYVLVDTNAKYQVDKNVGLIFEVKNIFDKKYVGDAWSSAAGAATGSPWISPGAPRAFFVSLNAKM